MTESRPGLVRGAAVLLAAGGFLAVAAGCGAGPGASGSDGRAGSDSEAAVEVAASALGAAFGNAARTLATPGPTPTVDPGTLPQTHDRPSAADPAFAQGIRLLWQAVASGQARTALPFFFPLSAYRQVKDISNPASDWNSRLVGFYDLDIGAVHASLGAGAASARFLGVTVPEQQVMWVNPGAEYNRIGYWRVYGTRVHYEVGGRPGSFGICSLISWRGRWYAVHLGPIVGRQAGVGALCRS